MAVKTVVCLYCVINVKFLLELGLLIGLFSVVGSLLYVAVGFIIGSTTCWTEMVMKQNLEQPWNLLDLSLWRMLEPALKWVDLSLRCSHKKAGKMCHQCFDTAGWTLWRTSRLWVFYQQSPNRSRGVLGWWKKAESVCACTVWVNTECHSYFYNKFCKRQTNFHNSFTVEFRYELSWNETYHVPVNFLLHYLENIDSSTIHLSELTVYLCGWMVTVLAWTAEGPGFKSWFDHLSTVGML